MINFLKQLLDFLYYEKCYLCKKVSENSGLCENCFKNLVKKELNQKSTIQIILGVPFYYAGYYANNLQKIIRGLKYHFKKKLAYCLALFMNIYWQKFSCANKHYTIIPVPLHSKRLKKRSFNHMDLVGLAFAKLSNNDINFELVKRVKNTKPQYGLKYEQRLENLKDAFSVDISKYNGESLLIIDDILTTGSTVRELTKTLKENGIEDITVFTVSAHLSRK